MPPPVAPAAKASAPEIALRRTLDLDCGRMISDCFDLLSEARRPWLNTDALKARFLQLSGTCHPDRFHEAAPEARAAAGERFATLNHAYQTLMDPKDRLLHLLVLERGSPPKDIQRIPPGTMDLFVEIGQTCRESDTFLAAAAPGLSPLVRVQRLRDARLWVQRLQRLQAQVSQKREEWLKATQELDARWIQTEQHSLTQKPLDRVEEIYRGLSYVARWNDQLQQRVADLLSIGLT